MEQTISRLKILGEHAKTVLKLRPCSGQIWLDCIYLVIIGALHLSIIPTLIGSAVSVDLLTPWLVTGFVAQKLPRAAFIAVLGALMIETHSSAPAGLYLCAYWVIAVTLTLVRSTLSWRHTFPWFVTFVVAELWIIGFESFVIALSGQSAEFTPMYFASQLLRIIIAAAIGMLFARRWTYSGSVEEIAI